jgi:hypothetical protein
MRLFVSCFVLQQIKLAKITVAMLQTRRDHPRARHAAGKKGNCPKGSATLKAAYVRFEPRLDDLGWQAGRGE